MSTRTKGYTYKRRRDGTRYRVYRRKTRYSNRFAGIKPKRASMRRSYITGFGAYYKKAGRAYGRPPSVVNHPDGRVIIRHAEYLEDVPSATAFAIATYPLNPGMQQTFPWLSRIAQNFEEWLPRGIFFEFKTTSSDMIVTGSTTPALGQISMATQYNSLDSNFTNNVQLLNYENASTCKPSQNLRHYIECKRSQTVMDEMYIRTGPIPPNADLRLYDLGKTSVSASNMQTNGQYMGQLWVSYEIELRKPKIPSTLPIEGVGIHWQIPAATTGITNVLPFGNATQTGISPTTGSDFQQSLLIGGAAAGRVELVDVPSGYYQVTHRASCGSANVGTFTLTPVSGCSLITGWQGSTLSQVQAPVNQPAIQNRRLGSAIIAVSNPNPIFTISWVSDLGTPDQSSDMWIVMLPINIT